MNVITFWDAMQNFIFPSLNYVIFYSKAHLTIQRFEDYDIGRSLYNIYICSSAISDLLNFCIVLQIWKSGFICINHDRTIIGKF